MQISETGFIKYSFEDLTQELVNKIFSYKDGDIFWKVSNNSRTKIGSVAGTLNNGYVRTIFHGLKVYNHQIIFLMINGYIPKTIDHIDRDKSNNKIENLRDASKSQQAQNRGIRSDNKSGYKGVHFHKLVGKWVAEICINGKDCVIGYYSDPKEAALNYNKKAKELFGNFEVLNKI